MGTLVWIASYPKSGNTWIRAFLHAYFAGEGGAFDLNALNKVAVTEAATGWFVQFAPTPQAKWTDETIMADRPAVHRGLSSLTKRSLFVKTHNLLGRHLGYPLITEAVTGGAICVVRNPLDVIPSFASHFDMTIDRAVDALATSFVKPTTERAVLEVQGTWSEHVASWTTVIRPGVIALRYEDLHADPVGSFGRLVRHLGLKRDPARLEAAIADCAFDRLSAAERAQGFRERPPHAEAFFRKGRVGGWRETLTPAQVARVVRLHAPQMRRFGYLDDPDLAHLAPQE